MCARTKYVFKYLAEIYQNCQDFWKFKKIYYVFNRFWTVYQRILKGCNRRVFYSHRKRDNEREKYFCANISERQTKVKVRKGFDMKKIYSNNGITRCRLFPIFILFLEYVIECVYMWIWLNIEKNYFGFGQYYN